jgi:hypothetical protein
MTFVDTGEPTLPVRASPETFVPVPDNRTLPARCWDHDGQGFQAPSGPGRRSSGCASASSDEWGRQWHGGEDQEGMAA